MKKKPSFKIGLILLVMIFFSCSLLDKIFSSSPPEPEPINAHLKDELCEKLDGSLRNDLCNTENDILASDIFSLFDTRFKSGVTTYEEVYNLFGPTGLEAVEPFAQFEIPTNTQFDLAGNGINRIFVWSDHKGFVRSIVFIRSEELTPLSKDTVMDLCKKFGLMKNTTPCVFNNTVVNAQDFFPIIQDRFPLERTSTREVLAVLDSYQYIDPPLNYKYFYRFGDNVDSQVLFYFNQQEILENLAFVGGFAPAPLDPEVLSDLCNQLNIESKIDKCAPGARVYTTDIGKEIRAAFPYGVAKYEDVQAKIGKYLYRFDPPVRDAYGKAVTVSWYDFVGNNFTRIRFDFDTNFIVTDIQFFIGDS